MEYAHRGRGRYRLVISFSVPFIAVLLLTSGCTQTLRQQYMDASDPCSSAREPIVKAGDDLDARQRQMANQMAQQQMQGHELPVVTNYGGRAQLNLGNALTNAVHQNMLASQDYARMKQQETGENAAAMLASVQGDASNDLVRMRSVTGAMQALRACRATQINLARSGSGSEADRVDKLRQQQANLTKTTNSLPRYLANTAIVHRCTRQRRQPCPKLPRPTRRSRTASGGRRGQRGAPSRSSQTTNATHKSRIASRVRRFTKLCRTQLREPKGVISLRRAARMIA